MLIGCNLIVRHKGDASFSQGSSVDFCWFSSSPWPVAPGRWNGMTHRCNCSLQNVICLCGQTALFVAPLIIFISFSDREAGPSQHCTVWILDSRNISFCQNFTPSFLGIRNSYDRLGAPVNVSLFRVKRKLVCIGVLQVSYPKFLDHVRIHIISYQMC